MKNINRMNYVMTGLPMVLILLGYFLGAGLCSIGLLLTMLTGAFHLIVAIGMFTESRGNDKRLTIYLAGVVVFFLLWITTGWLWIIALPPILAIYLSAILCIEAKKETL